MVALPSCILNLCNNLHSSIYKLLDPQAYLNWHCEQIGTQKEEPHQLVSVYGDEVANLAHRHSPHGHVGGAEAHYFIEDLCLEVKINIFFKLFKSHCLFFCRQIDRPLCWPVWLLSSWFQSRWQHSRRPGGKFSGGAGRRTGARLGRKHWRGTPGRRWSTFQDASPATHQTI